MAWTACVCNAAAPGVDITAYTKLPGGARGSLYVNDIFRHAAAAGVPRLSSDHSPHDFRFSPNASTTTGAPPAPPAGLKPLVDHGLWLPPGPGPSFITMAKWHHHRGRPRPAGHGRGGPYARPQFNSWTGRTWLWWPHAQGAPDAQTGTNYTAGVPNLRRWGYIMAGKKPTFMRSLECDISPHLYLDPLPGWGLVFDQRTGTTGDIYSLNPWYQGNPATGGISI